MEVTCRDLTMKATPRPSIPYAGSSYQCTCVSASTGKQCRARAVNGVTHPDTQLPVCHAHYTQCKVASNETVRQMRELAQITPQFYGKPYDKGNPVADRCQCKTMSTGKRCTRPSAFITRMSGVPGFPEGEMYGLCAIHASRCQESFPDVESVPITPRAAERREQDPETERYFVPPVKGPIKDYSNVLMCTCNVGDRPCSNIATNIVEGADGIKKAVCSIHAVKCQQYGEERTGTVRRSAGGWSYTDVGNGKILANGLSLEALAKRAAAREAKRAASKAMTPADFTELVQQKRQERRAYEASTFRDPLQGVAVGETASASSGSSESDIPMKSGGRARSWAFERW